MKQTSKPYAPLMLVLALTLFPFGWLTKLSSQANAIADVLFPTEAAHAVGHTLIFIALGAALLAAFPALRRRPPVYMAIILSVALGQEGFQLLYKGRGVVLNDLTDIGTDLVAAGLLVALWYMRANDQRLKINDRRPTTKDLSV
ncbi:MAG: hypothetical protein HGA45_18110 [Chloroflexales bacterium]|nr:hypothetical protein [Chloroflexales bacterium]